MSETADLIDAIHHLEQAINRLHEATHHVEVLDFNKAALLKVVLDLAPVPKLNLARATDAQQFREMHEVLFQRIRGLRLGRITRAQLEQLEHAAVQLSLIVHSATYPVFEQIDNLEDPGD